MVNIGLLGLLLLVDYMIIYFSYKYFEVYGLFVSLALLFVFATIQSTIFIDILGIPISIGSLVFSTTYIITGFASIYYESEVKKLINTAMMAQLSLVAVMEIIFEFNLSNPEQMNSLFDVFGASSRVVLASIIASYTARILQTKVIIKLKNNLAINISNIISQFVDTLLFMTLAFVGTMEFQTLLVSSSMIFVLKYLVTVLGIPFFREMKLARLEM